MARTGKTHARDGRMLPYLRHPAVYRLFFVAGRLGAARTPNITELTTFTDGDLDVPGRPRIVPTPGHSPGHVAFHLPDRGVLIGGDALCTYNPLTGKRGPQLMPKRVRVRHRTSAGVAGRARAHRRGPAAARPRRTLDGWPGRGGGTRPRIRGHVTACPPILMTRREVAPAA